MKHVKVKTVKGNIIKVYTESESFSIDRVKSTVHFHFSLSTHFRTNLWKIEPRWTIVKVNIAEHSCFHQSSFLYIISAFKGTFLSHIDMVLCMRADEHTLTASYGNTDIHIQRSALLLECLQIPVPHLHPQQVSEKYSTISTLNFKGILLKWVYIYIFLRYLSASCSIISSRC